MSHTSVRSIVIVAGVVVAAACASSGTSTPRTTSTPAPSASPVPAAPAPRRSDRSRLTPEEIATVRESNMYDVITKLRPQWLNTHGVASRDSTANQIQVFVDGTRQEGGVQSLRSIDPFRVTAARRLDGADASTRFGVGVAAGVIDISTRPN